MVRRRSFLIGTLAIPLLIAVVIAITILVAERDSPVLAELVRQRDVAAIVSKILTHSR